MLQIPGILEDPDAKLSGALRVLLAQLQMEMPQLQGQIDEADAVIKQTAGENEACRRLVPIPGSGPVTATALIAAIGSGTAFKKGSRVRRLVRNTTGGRQRLLGINKRGNSYLRRLFIQGAHAVLQQRQSNLPP